MPPRRHAGTATACQIGARAELHRAGTGTSAPACALHQRGGMCVDAEPFFLEVVLVLDLVVLIISEVRWSMTARPRPGVPATAVMVATCATAIASSITLVTTHSAARAAHATEMLALAGTALAMLVVGVGLRPERRTEEPIATARARRRPCNVVRLIADDTRR